MVAVSFVVGALCSGLAGFIGMQVATKANVRTTNAAQDYLGKALEIAFSGGSVMGMGVVGLGVLGVGSLFIIYRPMFTDINTVIQVLSGFSLRCFIYCIICQSWWRNIYQSCRCWC